MKNKGLSQETLKLIACVTMLIDHIGAAVVIELWHDPAWYAIYKLTRIIGRIAFPIYCLLLVEGAHYTRNPKKYALRLAVGVVLSEIPFDFAFFDGWTWEYQNVMLTLLLGFGMLEAMKRLDGFRKYMVILPFYLLAELLKTDYSGLGILIIALLQLTRGMEHERLVRTLGMAVLLYPGMRNWEIGGVMVNIEWFAILAMIPIACYDGRKLTGNKAVQWAFYLFYPVHMLLLWMVRGIFFG